MTAVPSFTPVTVPSEDTFATVSSEDVQITLVFAASAGVTEAVRTVVSFSSRFSFDALSVSPLTSSERIRRI